MTITNNAAKALDAKSAVAGFLNEFKQFQMEMKSKMKDQDTRITRLASPGARPVLSAARHDAAPHRKAIDGYLRGGDESALKALSLEGKSLNTEVLADGGFLVDPQTSESIQGILRNSSSLRSVASVAVVEAGVYDVLVDHTDIGAGWTSEVGSVAETDTPKVDRISITLNELSASPKASQRLLDDAAFDVEGWLAERIADRFTRAENAAFITGDGVDKPTGILTYSSVDNDAWTWGSIGYVPTGEEGDFAASDPADAIVDLIYALGADYRVNGAFIMNSKTAGAVRKMKDADGRFLWAEAMGGDLPARLMGYPVVIAEDMPDIGPDATAIAFGDFGRGYTIAEKPDIRVLRDPYSAKPHVMFYASKRVGGDVTDFAAIKLLKFAAS